jgi:hypothetical protein
MNRSWSLSNLPVRRFTIGVSQVVHAAKVGIVLVGMPKRTAILVERVQARTVELEKSASAIHVGAAHGSHFLPAHPNCGHPRRNNLHVVFNLKDQAVRTLSVLTAG